ncbi:LOW QUALITY PROTEIN: hypothetical protein PanWU01x14_089100 [Parasponia andersonii]|uniref:Secreted protein n=1 Tax=Parasponia andersonii TaxID=3476 RepID=A0A2P5D840_PARAD|nr:LOW QUALITY PROTEIN: hypothetical protein PanWU01x14_089100 [Parasponia andersonii]
MHPSLLFTSNLLFLYYCFSLVSSIAHQASFPACSGPSLIHRQNTTNHFTHFFFLFPIHSFVYIFTLSLSLSLPFKDYIFVWPYLSCSPPPPLFFLLKYHSLSEFILAHLRPQTPTCELLIWGSQPLEASGFWWASVVSGLHWPIYAY